MLCIEECLCITETLITKYSLGSHPDEMIEDYLSGIEYLENVGNAEPWYVDVLRMVSLGILLEVDKKDLKRLACAIEKQKIEDALLDFLLKACDIGWNHNTSRYERKNPYAKTAEIRLQQYVEKEWIKGHNDLDWKNAHKEPGYVGLWSFEAAKDTGIGRQRTER